MDENMKNENSFSEHNEYNAYASEQADQTVEEQGTTKQEEPKNTTTGNGSYAYSETTYHNAYENSYGTNHNNGNTYSSSYNSAYSGGNYQNGSYQNNQNGSFQQSNHSDKDKKGVNKIVLAVALAAVFGVCAGAGAWGISRVAGSSNASEASAGSENTTDQAPQLSIAEDNTASTEDANTAENTPAAEESSAAATLHTAESSGTDYGVTDIVEDVMPQIVSVYNNYTQQTRDMFGQTYSQEGTSTGSGIIIAQTDDELLIVTNNHVVDGEDSLEVQFIDETTADANIKGTDEANDLAVIAVALDTLSEDTLNSISVATLGNSEDLKVGETVIAIGNALGYGQSVTTGVVSALDREITADDGTTNAFIQTDAAINPGNSGGALVDMNGHVIGINSNKIGGTTVEGMGYAIPTARAIPIIEELMNQSTKSRVSEDEQGYLGIRGVSVTSQVAAAYNMPEGVYIADMFEGGGAASSDLQNGDIITGINGSTVDDMTELQSQLRYYAAGTEVTLTVQRAESGTEYKEMEIKVTLGDKNSVTTTSESSDSNNSSNNNNSSRNSNENNSNEESGNGFYSFPWNQW